MHDVHGRILLRYSGIDVLHWYGAGNDTDESGDRDFYEVKRGLIRAEPTTTVHVSEDFEADLNVRFDYSRTDTVPDEPTLVSETRPYGVGSFGLASIGAGARLDTRDRIVATTRGPFVLANARFFPGVLDLSEGAFTRIGGEASTYLSLTEKGDHTLAIRVGGEKIWGDPPYFEAAFLGGHSTLRGYRSERFAGDATVYGSAELRLRIASIGLFVPWHVGVLGFTDIGRVYVDGASPGGWNSSAGFGVWGAPIYRRMTGTATVAFSPEGPMFYLGTGFGI
jgi:outer membrane protein assembly factor BamA